MKYLPFCLLFLVACTPEPREAETTTMPPTDLTVEPSQPDSLLRHAVLFSFKEESGPEDIAKVAAAFAALPGKIPAIMDFEWGTNNSPEGLDRGFTHMFLLTFASEADRDAYLPHPDHQAFGEVLGPHLKDVLVLDYWARSGE